METVLIVLLVVCLLTGGIIFLITLTQKIRRAKLREKFPPEKLQNSPRVLRQAVEEYFQLETLATPLEIAFFFRLARTEEEAEKGKITWEVLDIIRTLKSTGRITLLNIPRGRSELESLWRYNYP